MFNTLGKIRYSPQSRGSNDSKYWVIVDCDPEIGRYYRHLYFNSTYNKLQRPAWECHVTVVRNEEPPEIYKSEWLKHDGKIINLEIIPPGNSDGTFFWLDVKCDYLNDLRQELGILRDPIYPFHLTFGNAK